MAKQGLWELDQIRPILVSHLGIFREQKCEEERRREEEEEEEEEEKKKKKKKRKGMELGICMETLSMEVFVWILVVPFLGFS